MAPGLPAGQQQESPAEAGLSILRLWRGDGLGAELGPELGQVSPQHLKLAPEAYNEILERTYNEILERTIVLHDEPPASCPLTVVAVARHRWAALRLVRSRRLSLSVRR